MPRKQISAMETCPLNSLDDRNGLNDEHDGKGQSDNESLAVTPTLSNKSKNKSKYDDDDDDDEKPVQDSSERVGHKDLLLYYAKNSTMHGIPTIVGSELYRGRHIFWTGVVCVMAILLGTVVYFQMSNYYDYPTVTSVDIRYVGENDFPALTMCNLNVFDGKVVKDHLNNYTSFQLTKLTEITGLYRRFGARVLSRLPEPPRNGSSDEEVSKMLEALLKFSKQNVYCSWGEYFWTVCPAVTYRVTEMGICATMDVRKLPKINVSNETEADKDNLPAIGNALRGLTLYADINSDEIPNRLWGFNGFKVVLHDPDEFPLPLSSGFLVTGNTSAEVEVSKTVKMGLPAPYKAFGSGSCVDTLASSFENPLKRYEKYSKEVCEAECFVDFAVKVCGGCRHFLHPGNESVCPVDHLAVCYRDAEKQYYGGHVNESIGRPSCRCQMPCTQAMYRASVTTSPFDQTTHFKNLLRSRNRSLPQTLAYMHVFYSDPVVSEMRQVAVFSMEGLLGNIGGQIGLFMGFSLVSVAEMLELIFLLVTRGRNLDERVKRHKNSEAAAQAALQA